MSYTTIWNESAPTGSSTLASDLDTVVQNLKRDIRERMNTLVTDWNADPIRLKSTLFKTFDKSTSNTVMTSLDSYVMPANTLAADGDQLHIVAFGVVISGGSFFILLGATTVLGFVLVPAAGSPGRAWKVEVDLVRLGSASEYVCMVRDAEGGTSGISIINPQPTEDLATDLLIDFKGFVDVGTGSLVLKGARVELPL